MRLRVRPVTDDGVQLVVERHVSNEQDSRAPDMDLAVLQQLSDVVQAALPLHDGEGDGFAQLKGFWDNTHRFIRLWWFVPSKNKIGSFEFILFQLKNQFSKDIN